MAFINTRVAALLFSLAIALSAATTASGDARMAEQASDSKYLKAQITAAINQVEKFLSKEVAKKLKDPATDKQCVLVCQDVYENGVEALKKGLESISAGDFFKANFDLSAFNTNIDTCDECFDDFQKFDAWAKGIGGDCLDKIVKYRN